jgi:DNA-binding NarL/FixJ family response regulator
MKKILVVEDETNIRNNIAEILTLSGYDVCTAENGADALNALDSRVPSLIISDILMPHMNGYELLAELQKSEQMRDIPFLFLSAKTDQKEIREGMNLGADDYLTKPVKAQDLIHAIEARMERRRVIRDAMIRDSKPDAHPDAPGRDLLLSQLKEISKSEMRVLKKLADNRSSTQIADELYLSFRTVQNHRANMAKKLNMCGQNALLSFALHCKMYQLFDEVTIE